MKEIAAKVVLRTFGSLMMVTFLAFVTLKLCGILPWSWWWICAPIWGPTLFFLVLSGLFALAVALFASQTKIEKKGGRK